MLQRQTLLALGGIGKAVRVNGARQLAITRGQLVEIQAEARLQLKQSKVTRGPHSKPQMLKLSPQPHSPRTLGLLNLKPSFNPSLTKSSSVPSRYTRLFGSMITFTP